MNEPNSQWIKASEALNLMADRYGNSHDVKAWLADALRDGKLTAKAAKTWLAAAANLSFKIPADPIELQQDLIVPVGYWRGASKVWNVDQQRWRWPYDQAVVTVRLKPLTRRVFRGLEFRRADVDRLLRTPGRATKQAGRKTAAAKWGLVAAKLFEMEQFGELAAIHEPSANGVADKLHEHTDGSFGETALWDFSNAFLENYRRLNLARTTGSQ
jgi:hypothetical protein